MKNKRRLIPVIAVVVLVVAIAAYFIYQSQLEKKGVIGASGTIEADQIIVSPEIGGRVIEALFEEGAVVHSGDVLFRLDDSLLAAQRQVAAAGFESAQAAVQTSQAALENARAQYDLALAATRAESKSLRLAAWQSPSTTIADRPNWYFSRAELIEAAQAEVDSAYLAIKAAEAGLEQIQADSASADYLEAESRLLLAQASYLVASDVLNHANLAYDSQPLLDAAQTLYDDARAELDDARSVYDDLAGTEIAQNVLDARADLAVAQERYDASLDRLLALQTGDYSPRLVAARAAVRQAESAVVQAQGFVAQARAQLALIDTQIEKFTVLAPVDGVVLTGNIQAGEVVAAGSTALTLVRLDDLTITVYIPEDRYGEISLGQSAQVSVDSFPDETFTAVVTHIASRAEFTPRNVQTVEGRKTTMFAIRLRVEDPQGKLKPGMPADVSFQE